MNKEDLKIEIRPIPGRNKIREFSENLEYFSQPHTIAPLVDPQTRRYVTGLTKEDKEYLKKQGVPYNLSDVFIDGEPHEFWESNLMKVELKNTPMFLYPYRSTIDYIKWKWLRESVLIYSSLSEMEEGGKSAATHYIHDEHEENKIKATNIDRRDNIKSKVSKLSPKQKRDIILLVYNEDTENKDANYLTVRFDDIMQSEEKLAQLEEFLEWKKESVTLASEIRRGIQKNVLTRTKKGIKFFDNTWGYTEDEVRNFLSDPENQEAYLSFKEKLTT